MRSRFLWRALRARYRDQRIELAAIRAAIRADGIAVDVGANRGSYLYWLSRWAPAGRVVAFEPQGELARYLAAVAATMSMNNVTVESRGVSDRPGELEFHVPGGRVTPGASFSRRVAEREPCAHETKEVVTLDGYFEAGAPISVVKVDVEGLELQVFKGAARILGESSPLLVFECENRHLEKGSVADVLQFLWAHGYDGHFIQRNRLAPARSFDATIHQKEVGARFFTHKDYCNNFIFRKIT
jgi:FkbM family methyltransferase